MRVERAGLDLLARLADEPDDPLAQLAGGPVRERDGEDPQRRDALDPDEVRDPVRQHARLAGARSRENQHGTLGRRDRARLLGVQPPEDLPPPRVRDLGLVLLLRRLRRGILRGLGVGHVRRLGQPRRLGRQRSRGLAGDHRRELLEPRPFGLRGSLGGPVASAPAWCGSHPRILVGGASRPATRAGAQVSGTR